MNAEDPAVSVVIATRLREVRLGFALERLASQTLPKNRFEVIVVRSPDGLGVPLAEAPEGLHVKFLVADTPGAAAQRNAGWRAACAPYVAFTDDDCRVAEDWLERILEHASSDLICQGRTEPDPEEAGLLYGFSRSMEVTGLDPWAPTCNLLYPRSLLEAVGGFDESFPGAWGEDTDLAQRVMAAGGRPVFVPDAVAWHAVHSHTFLSAANESLRRSNISAVVARHPELRSALHGGVFIRPSHGWLIFGWLIAFALRRHPAAALFAFAPYVNALVERPVMPAKSIPRFLILFVTRRAAMEAVEIAGMTYHSARNRTVVL